MPQIRHEHNVKLQPIGALVATKEISTWSTKAVVITALVIKPAESSPFITSFRYIGQRYLALQE